MAGGRSGGSAGGPVTFGGLLRGSLLYTIGSVVPRVGIFLLLPVYTRGMGPAEFGIFSLMLSLAGLLTILYRLGQDGALLRFHFDLASKRAAALYWTLTAITVVAGIAFSLVLVTLAGPVFAAIFAGIDLWPYGWLAAGIALVTALQFVPTTWFRATEHPERVVGFGLATFVVGAGVTLALVLVLHLGAVGGLLGQLAAGLVAVGVTIALLSRRRPARIDPELAREGLRFGLPLVPHGLAGWVLNLSDRWVIGLTIGLGVAATQRAIGIYSLGYQLGQVVAVVGLALNTAWVPFFYVRGEHERGPELLREMTSLSIGALAILTAFAGALAPDVVDVLAPPSWGSDAAIAAQVTPLVAIASLVQGLYLMAVSPVFLRKRTAALPLFTLFAGAVNVGLNLLLIPRIGVVGAAWSTIAGYGALAAGTIWYARRDYRLDFDWPRLAALVAIDGGAILASLAVQPATLLVSGAAHLAIGLVAAGTIAVVVLRPWSRARMLVAATGWATGDAASPASAAKIPPESLDPPID